jgi:uncharacterized membrane protein YeaQ/YmgE (transglycosylase-associated protein family)
MDVIAWLVVGLVAGALARLLVPGRDPMGIAGTMLLGLVGSVIGGLVGNLLVQGDQDFSPAGLIGSILGAVVALVAYRAAMRRGGVGPARG